MSEAEEESKPTTDSPPRVKKPRLVSEESSSSPGDGPQQTKDGEDDENDSKSAGAEEEEEEEDGSASGSGSDSQGDDGDDDDDGSSSNSDDSDDDSDSIEEEELSGLLWPTRDGVKHADPQEQMQALVQDMMAMREENANLMEQHVEGLKKRKAPAV